MKTLMTIYTGHGNGADDDDGFDRVAVDSVSVLLKQSDLCIRLWLICISFAWLHTHTHTHTHTDKYRSVLVNDNADDHTPEDLLVETEKRSLTWNAFSSSF